METMNEEKLIKYLLQESDAEESKAVQDWISEDEANQKQFEKIKWIWDSSSLLLEKSEVDENQAWQKFTELRNKKIDTAPKQNQRFLQSKLFRVAAAITLIFISAWVYSAFLPQSGRAYFSSVELQSEDTPIEVPLLDGTAITLNRNTTLSYSQKLFTKERKVTLENGEAFFDVKRNEQKPFVIQSEAVQITVLGTSFHVKTTGNITEVIVVTGSVQVEIDGKKEVLRPEEKLSVNQESGEMLKTIPSNNLYNYYVSKKFQADEIRLQELVTSLNEAYDSNIEIAREELKDLAITTTLEYDSLDKNLEVLRETLNLTIIRQDGKIIIQ
ncbi:FecR family protein [Algoriphagus yeomjeoni]|uniref:FecR family protein n=1 Tax=Algoriphagus yeomjeoni TaxID=291403 RepID=A0A327PJ37_9BACT|nr:FecR domain-containing protein [Algoriphagus yeomjeoni]RAI91517.1 FecR family protein [Algoriphagus yeomjeoni]